MAFLEDFEQRNKDQAYAKRSCLSFALVLIHSCLGIISVLFHYCLKIVSVLSQYCLSIFSVFSFHFLCTYWVKIVYNIIGPAGFKEILE